MAETIETEQARQDRLALDRLATGLGTKAEWGSDELEWIATLVGDVRPHPGDSADDYLVKFHDARGYFAPEAYVDEDYDGERPEGDPNAPSPDLSTWTVFGHWEDDEIVADLILPGEHEDTRESDDERWPEGLFCDSTEARTADEALTTIRHQYED